MCSTPGVGSLFWFTAMFQTLNEEQAPLYMSIEPKPTAMLVAQNETLRNTLLRVFEAMGMIAQGVPHTSQLNLSELKTDVLILCPASQYEEGHSIAMHDAPKDGDDLQVLIFVLG